MPDTTPPVPPVPPAPATHDAIVPPQPNPYVQPVVQPLAQPDPYAQPNPYAQPDPYGQPNPYAQPNPYGQPNPYAQPVPYGQPNPYVAYSTARTNPLSIVSFVASLAALFIWFLGSLTAIVTGHIALNQIKKTGEAGHGFALAGVIIGYVGFGLTSIFVILYVIFIVAVVSSGTYSDSGYSG